jgi:polysaccharide biosynthesis protein PslH
MAPTANMRIGVFIDGTFIPERDGASTRFAKMPRHLSEQGVHVVVFHCYRGWSDLRRIASEPFPTYFFPPAVFYNDFECLARIVREERLDIIQMNDAETVQRIGYPLAESLGLRLVYEAHYHTSTLAASLDAPPDRVDALRALEKDVSQHIDRLIVFTDADRRRWVSLSGFPESRISVVPFGVDPVPGADASDARHSIVFLGNLFYEPNQRAARRIASEIVPVVERIRSGTPTVVIGDIPNWLRAECAAAGITVTGEVRDPSAWLLKGAVGIAPISEGSGVRAKILQYLAAGMPVVATPIAAESLHLPAVFLEDGARATALRCVDMLERPYHYKPFVSRTTSMLQQGLLWRDIAQLAQGVYGEVMSGAPVARPAKQLVAPCMPLWIEEVFRNGRFRDADTSALGRYRFGLAAHGALRTYS